MAGEIGIRTHDGLSSPVLETGALDRYATLLYRCLPQDRRHP